MIVGALHILIPKGAAHAQLGVTRTLLVFSAPKNGILSSAIVILKVWSVRKAIQAAAGGADTPSPRGAWFARTLAYRVLNQSQ
jgi:hypothetical protein